MDELLEQHELYFRPRGAAFDLAAAAAVVEAIGFPLHDPFVPSIWLVFLDAETRAVCEQARRADPKAPLPYVLLIDLAANEIMLNLFCGPDYAEHARAFLTWLGGHHRDCTVTNEEGTDLTAEWLAATG
ncbi:MAG: hypothetical protein KDC98_21035 [Planctomycetes bacterium]|nr:hypothetical protein [Planctomycetota bacterium]